MAAKPVYNEAPFPETYDECVAEIRRLRVAVLRANEKWAAAMTKTYFDQKSRRRKKCGSPS